MAQQRDLYQVLGVPRDATQDDIKRAFRRLAREHHPDVNHGDPDAEHRFKEVSVAYETLSDPRRRQQYDVFGGEGFTPDMFGFMGDVSDIFEAFFGSPFGRRTDTARRRTRRERGADLRAVVDLTFEEAAFGAQREIAVESHDACPRCEGSGSEPGTHPTRCPQCAGSGQVSDVRRSMFGTVMTSRACPRCEGTGEEIESPCRECRGEGRVPKRRTVRVEIPAGVADGMELRVEGGGQGGRLGGPPGDLSIRVDVEPHPVFERHGQDLLCTLDLPLALALLGGEVEIETLDGRERLRIPAGTRAGMGFRVRGAGLPHVGRRGRGDLLVRADIDVPDRLSRKERAAAEELARLQGIDGSPIAGRLRRPS
jgi:molecular chaperone DnaJ